MREFMALTKALSDENRVRILLALRVRELCVCQITRLLNLAFSTVSKHMAILRQAGLVDSRKEGRWIFYRLPDQQSPPAVQTALEWTFESLRKDLQVREDARRLKQILKMDRETLCQKLGKI